MIVQGREGIVKKRPQDILGLPRSPTQSHVLLIDACIVAREELEGLSGICLWEEDVRVTAEEQRRHLGLM